MGPKPIVLSLDFSVDLPTLIVSVNHRMVALMEYTGLKYVSTNSRRFHSVFSCTVVPRVIKRFDNLYLGRTKTLSPLRLSSCSAGTLEYLADSGATVELRRSNAQSATCWGWPATVRTAKLALRIVRTQTTAYDGCFCALVVVMLFHFRWDWSHWRKWTFFPWYRLEKNKYPSIACDRRVYID